MISVWLAVLGAAFAECGERTSRDDLEGALDDASTAYERADLRAFEDALEASRAAVPCLEAAVPPSVAAKLHRIEALGAFVASDADRVRLAFGAARRLEPAFGFPEAWAPEGNPLRMAYSEASDTSAVEEVSPPSTGSVRFDGRPTRERPTEHPTLYQWLGDTSSARRSAYLWPQDPLPGLPPPVPEQRSARVPLWLGAGTSVLVGGALIGGAAASRRAYDGSGTTLANADGRRTLTNGLLVGSGVAFAAGVTFGAAGLAVGP